MALFRLIGFVLVVGGLMMLGADVVASFETGEDIVVRSLEQFWTMIDQASLDSFRAWVETTLPEPVPGAVATVLSWPGWAVLGVPGILLAFLARGRD